MVEQQTDPLEEPPDEAQVYTETDPSGRYGRFDTVLGRGAFKTVYKAFDTEEGTEVAWNQVKVGELMGCNNKEERDRLFAEIRVLKQLKHRNIMTFYDSWLDPKTMSINFITELFTSGTLRQYRKRHRHIDEEVLKRWAWQILCGLVYLHGHTPPIIHRDLKCDNIFINGSDGTVKIGDLGLATMLRSRTAPQSVLGTPEFMAPELYEEEYDDRVDVYSFGMCMLELATMEYPYAECKNAAQIYRKVSLGVRPAGLQKVTNQELADFINLCISPRDQRPRSRTLLKHPYFDSIRPPGQLASKSQVGLSSMANQPDGLSDYGSGGGNVALSRSSSSTAEADMVSAAGPALATAASAPPPGLPVAPRPSMAQAPAAPAAAANGPLAAPMQLLPAKSHADLGAECNTTQQQQQPREAAAAAPCVPPMGPSPGEPSSAVAAAEEEEEEEEAAAVPVQQQQQEQVQPPVLPPQQQQQAPSEGAEEEMEEGGEELLACECGPTHRTFMVVGKYAEDNDTFSLRLRICDPGGSVRTVEFEFDIGRDTAISVASEMVEDLQLSQEDAASIATAIRNEIASLTSHLEEQVSLSLEQASAALQEGLQTAALANSSPRPGTSYMEHAAALPAQRTAAGGAGEEGGSGPTTGAGAASVTVAPAAAAAAAPQAAAPASGPSTRETSPAGEPSLGPAPPRHAPVGFVGTLPAVPDQPATTLVRANSFSSASSLQSLASANSSVESAVTALSHLSGTTKASYASAVSGLSGLAPVPVLSRPTSPPVETGSLGALAGPGVLPPGRDATAARLPLMRSQSAASSSTLLSRASVSGKEAAVLSPSGALSPPSGVLSPTLAHDKRIPLNKLFENLQGLQSLQNRSGGSDASAATLPQGALPARSPGPSAALPLARAYSTGGSGGSLADELPSPGGASALGEARLPLFPAQPQQHGRHLSGSLSGSALADGGTLIPQEAFMPRPASEACLAGLLERFDPFNLSSGPEPAGAVASSAPGGPAVLAGAASEPQAPRCPGSPLPPFRGTFSSTLGALGHGAALARPPLQEGARGGVNGDGLQQQHFESAPGSKTASRDTSPMRSAAMSPTRAAIAHDSGAAFAYDSVAGQQALLAKKGKTDADKEALRKQAADAMKAVELRSLNLLEGGLLAGKVVRGTPMAATRVPSGLGCSAPAAGGAAAAGAGPVPPAGAVGVTATVPVVVAVGRDPSPQESRAAP